MHKNIRDSDILVSSDAVGEHQEDPRDLPLSGALTHPRPCQGMLIPTHLSPHPSIHMYCMNIDILPSLLPLFFWISGQLGLHIYYTYAQLVYLQVHPIAHRFCPLMHRATTLSWISWKIADNCTHKGVHIFILHVHTITYFDTYMRLRRFCHVHIRHIRTTSIFTSTPDCAQVLSPDASGDYAFMEFMEDCLEILTYRECFMCVQVCM